MGCNSSKSDDVLPNKGQAWPSPRGETPTKKPGSGKKSSKKSSLKKSKDIERVKSQDDIEGLIKTDRSSSQHSLNSETNVSINRGVSSATSKVSTHTHDSGLEEDFLPNMITETSAPKEQEVANADRPPTPDLGVIGTCIQSRQTSSKSTRSVQSSNTILNGLRNEGLLAAFGQKNGGMSFDVMIAPEFGILRKPPARLGKLKKVKKGKKEMTHEELEAKMKAAEERRKRKEAKMIAKLNTSAKELQVHKVANTHETIAKEQTEVKITKTLDKAEENRKAHLNALREKLQAKQKRAEKVRLARLERLAEGHPTQEDDEAAV